MASETGVEVVVITFATVDPLRVSYEVMVFTTGVWVVEGASVVLLPALVVAASLLDEVDEVEEEEEEEEEDDVVGLGAVVGSADEVVEVEEVDEVVCSLVVLGSVEVEEVDVDDEVVGVGSSRAGRRGLTGEIQDIRDTTTLGCDSSHQQSVDR